MLIGAQSNKPSLETVRRIKRALRQALALSEDVTLTVTELACLEEGCSPVETAFGLLRPGAAALQTRRHKPMEAIDAEDLVQVSSAWGFEINVSDFESFTQEKR